MLDALLTMGDGQEAPRVVGEARTVVDYISGIDWQQAIGIGDRAGESNPRLDIVRQSNGDLLSLEFDTATDEFQCAAIVTVPKKVLGISSYLWNGNWESAELMLDRDAALAAVSAFCDGDIDALRAIWDERGAL